jgi:hypothetical protein
MNELCIENKNKVIKYTFPESLSECSDRQLEIACRAMIQEGYSLSNDFIKDFCELKKDDFKLLTPIALHNIRERCLAVIKDCDASYDKSKIKVVEIGKTPHYGVEDRMSNLTWEEFIYADQFLMKKEFVMLAATLYRPQKKQWDKESDRRISFTPYGLQNRLPEFEKLKPETIIAITVNYRALRRKCIEGRYRQIFPYWEKQEEEEQEPEEKPEKPETFSWAKIHKDLMGDYIHEEPKFLKLNMHNILYKLDRLIEENRKNKNKK